MMRIGFQPWPGTGKHQCYLVLWTLLKLGQGSFDVWVMYTVNLGLIFAQGFFQAGLQGYNLKKWDQWVYQGL